MGKAALCMLVGLALLSGCSPTDSGNAVADYPTPNAQIIVSGYAQVQSPMQSGKTAYSITCAIQNQDQSKSNSEFNSATATVNGIALGRYSDGVFVNVGEMQFSQGDSLEFIVKHPKIGTIKQVLSVPPSISDYTVSPGMPAQNFTNNLSTFFLSWTPVDANLYYVATDCYNAREVFMTEYGFSTSADTITVVVQDSTNHPYPFLQFRLMSFNAASVTGFAIGSGFYVEGTYFKVYSNL